MFYTSSHSWNLSAINLSIWLAVFISQNPRSILAARQFFTFWISMCFSEKIASLNTSEEVGIKPHIELLKYTICLWSRISPFRAGGPCGPPVNRSKHWRVLKTTNSPVKISYWLFWDLTNYDYIALSNSRRIFDASWKKMESLWDGLGDGSLMVQIN